MYEWLIVGLMVSALLLLAAIALFKEKPRLPQTGGLHAFSSPTIEVEITGAVLKPGMHTVKREMRLKEFIHWVQPGPLANLEGFKGNRKLKDGDHIHVPEQVWITIHLQGAVQTTGSLPVLKGTRLCDLAKKVAFLPSSDVQKLKKARLLCDGEIVDVPFKAIKKRQKKKEEKRLVKNCAF